MMASNPKQCTKVIPCHKIIYDTLSCIQTSAYNCITKETQDIINELKYLVDNNYLSYKLKTFTFELYQIRRCNDPVHNATRMSE